jgi:DNA-binding MarR family transcriptional regulator
MSIAGKSIRMVSFRHSQPADRPGFLLWRAALRWQREVSAALRANDLTHVQFVLLATVCWLTDRGPAPSQREVAEHAGTDPMMTSQVLRILADRELVARQADKGDARVRRLIITERGRALAESASRAVASTDRRFFRGITQKTLRSLLGDLANRDKPDR